MSVLPGEPAGGFFARQEQAMGIEVNVTREFVINGKHCHSLEEVPPDVRQAIGDTLESPTGVTQAGTAGNQAKIIVKLPAHRAGLPGKERTGYGCAPWRDAPPVNGRPYGGIDAMPGGVPEIYEVAMQCIGCGPGSQGGKSETSPKPITPQGTFSLSGRWVMAGSLLLCLLVSLLLLLLPR